MAADLAHQAAEEAARLGARGTARGAQHRSHGSAVAVEHDERLEAVRVVAGVEQAQLLPAMHRVERVVEVEHDTARHLAEAGAVERHHGASHAQQRPQVGQVLEPRDGRLRAQRRSIGQAIERELEGGVVAQHGGVVPVFVASRDHQQAEADDLGQAVPDPLRAAGIVETGSQAIGDAEPALDLAQRQHAAIGGQPTAVEAGDQGLAANR